MTRSIDTNLRDLPFYLSRPHACSYLPDREAVTLLADPERTIDTAQLTALSHYGFRRSGGLVYRPQCPGCSACIPVRIPADEFRPRRVQRRIWRRNQDLEVRCKPAALDEEQYELYCRYIRQRHPGGGMDNASPEKYLEFLVAPAIDTAFYEFREEQRLVAVAVVDHLTDALSAVYTFFDPDVQTRSLGTYVLLWQIDEARRLRLPWVYLGYWIRECQKMAYKGDFRPLDCFRSGKWHRLV